MQIHARTVDGAAQTFQEKKVQHSYFRKEKRINTNVIKSFLPISMVELDQQRHCLIN